MRKGKIDGRKRLYLVSAQYNVVDSIFVGRGVGSAVLGAVNIGVPFITFVVAIADMFPMGGAIVARRLTAEIISYMMKAEEKGNKPLYIDFTKS